jgi:hypothetical protein
MQNIKKYGYYHFKQLEPLAIEAMISKVPIRQMAKDMGLDYQQFANMLYRNGLKARDVRHQHNRSKAND